MGKYRYFELDEFIVSSKAQQQGIANIPSFEVVEHLGRLVEEFLDPLRAAYGMPIIVSSGFRCDALNIVVGGVPTSAHRLGWAVDLQVKGSFQRFVDFVVEWVKKTGRKFDQILIESDSKGNKWLHVGLYNSLGQQRGQIKVLNI